MDGWRGMEEWTVPCVLQLLGFEGTVNDAIGYYRCVLVSVS